MAEVKTKAPRLILRFLLRIFHPSKGKIWTEADIAEVRGFIRFIQVFAVTILLPGFALAALGLRMIQTESSNIITELRAEAEIATELSSSEIRRSFSDFEEQVRVRVASGQSAVEGLQVLSPHLRVAFQLGSEGELRAPLHPPESFSPGENDLLFNETWIAAEAAARAGEHSRAASLFQQVRRELRGDFARGQAMWRQGQSLLSANRTGEAKALFQRIVEEMNEVRDAQGFRVGDLSRLALAELEPNPDVSEAMLVNLVEDLLAERWTIDKAGESAVVSRAIELLEDRAETTWLATQRGRLENRASQLFWAGVAFPKIPDLISRGLELGVDQFFYLSEPPIHWAAYTRGEDTILFAFELAALEGFAKRTAAKVTNRDPEIRATLLNAWSEVPAATLARRTLAPELPGWSIIGEEGDLEMITRKRKGRMYLSIVMITLPLMLLLAGGFVSVRLVSRELEVASMKADFAANVSHDLRSPITQIRLKGEFLQLGLADGEEEIQEHYDIIVRESERLSRLVDNVLDFSAIESGRKRYRVRPADITETVRAAVEASRFSMETRDMEMEVDLADGLPVILHEPEAVGQVIQNLISNAAKYGEQGGWIGVKAELGHNTVEISVSDRGIGISEEELPHIFEKFFRSESDLARRQKGTGIGLTIVQYIMEAHHGAVRVKSTLGQGTTFTLHFPTRTPIASGL